MSSKKIYQQFIKKTAAEGKSIVAWDASRRYEGVFKQFDPTGEFVVLTNVWVSEGQETIFVSEMLLPLESLTIVSAGLPVESFEEETYEEFGAVYPAEASQEVGASTVPESTMAGDTAFNLSYPESSEMPVRQKEEAEKPFSEAPPVESAVSKLINLPTPTPSTPPETPFQPLQSDSAVTSQKPFSSAGPSTNLKSEPAAVPAPVKPETKAETEVKSVSTEPKQVAEKKEELLEEKTAPMEKVKAGFGKLPGFFQKIFQRKPKQEYPQDVARKIPPTPAYQAIHPRRVVPPGPPRPAVSATSSPAAHPQVIQRRSAQVSTSAFFSQPVPNQAIMPKQKVDIGTLILDILIGILTLVVIAIVAMGFLGIKIPSLPF